MQTRNNGSFSRYFAFCVFDACTKPVTSSHTSEVALSIVSLES